MKKVLKMTALILLCSMLVGIFVSCDHIYNYEEITDTTETTGGEQDDKTVIAIDGNTQYKMIRPDDTNPDKEFLGAFLKVKNSIDEKANSNIPLGMDFKRANESYDSQTYEILIGNTGYDETKEVMNSIDFYEFAIRAVGNKIVIAAHTKELIVAACEHFSDNVIATQTNSDGKNELVYLGDYSYKSPVNAFFSDENKLQEYVIIYPSNNQNKADAEKLAKFILDNYKITLEVKPDSVTATAKEILIGVTNRAESIKHIGASSTIDKLTQVLKTEEYKIVIAGKAEFATQSAVLTFINLITNKKYSYMCNIPNTTNIQNVAFPGADSKELAEGANLRIMSYNILSEEWNDKLPLTNRDNYVAATILHYSPDVVGLQELSVKWYNALPSLISSEYTMVNMKNSKNEWNYSGMAYNKHKVKLIESGTDIFTGTSTRIRLVNWGYYEKLDTKERFFVMNTHWSTNQTSRLVESQEMATLYNKYKAKYNCPIITTGDYNANQDSTEYKYYVENTGLKEAGLHALIKNRQLRTYHTVGVAPNSEYTKAIDHIFYSSDVSCLYYNVLIDQIVLDSSDHNPIYADFFIE